MGVVIVGASFDDPEVNQEWAEEEAYLFDLWTDDDKTLAVTYGAASSTSASFPSRQSFLIDASGTLILEYTSVNVSTHARDVLSDCEILFGD